MPKFRLSPGATSVKMQDGTFYRGRGSSKRGMVVDVSPDHAPHLARQAKENGHLIEQGFTAPRGVEGRHCDACNRSWWPWQTECPRCGAETKEVIPA